MDKDYGLLNDNEVLFVRSGRVLMENPTFKVSEFLDALAQLISEHEEEWSEEMEGWFTDRGQNCEVLRFGNQGWQRGRVRIRLEFCPERSPKLLRDANQRENYTREDVYPQEDVYPTRRGRGEIYQREDTRWEGGTEIYPDIQDEY